MKGSFVEHTDKYKKLLNMIKGIFNTDNDLPDKVFKETYNHFLFGDCDWTMYEEFWGVLKLLMTASGDKSVLTAVMDPDPVGYYYKEFGYFNWFTIPLEASDDEYYTLLETSPEDSIADAILYNSYTILWLSSSGKWGIWGDRSSGICVLGIQNLSDFDEDITPGLKNWRSLDETVKSWIELNFLDNNEMYNKFVSTLDSNYAISKK
ncbi:hypothetical protein V1498_10390 [Peribacillus sp. SCS-26]|uniref:hypothetical protein n=1 Tax=Paraperibacillus marinus TaxID=3115295 RepID=UPI003905ACAF